jgi:hypothetical protein
MNKAVNLTDNLQKLSSISTWFDQQEGFNVEEGLVKVKRDSKKLKMNLKK